MNLLHHSASVHVPLALAILFPVSQILVLALMKSGFFPPRTWLLQWGLSGVQLAASGLAYLTGLRDAPFSPADSELLLSHQNLAKLFLALWLAAFVLIPLNFRLKSLFRSRVGHLILLAVLIAQLLLAVRLGQIGGKLVFGS